SNTCPWTPTRANPNAEVSAWVRSAGITADIYDRPQSSGSIPFAVGPNLTLSSLTPDKAAPQPPGTTVTFTATATGGTAPYSYKWWVSDEIGRASCRERVASKGHAGAPNGANPNAQ